MKSFYGGKRTRTADILLAKQVLLPTELYPRVKCFLHPSYYTHIIVAGQCFMILLVPNNSDDIRCCHLL